MTMTLGQVRDKLCILSRGRMDADELREMADVIDAHMAAVREVIEELNGYCEASDESCYGTLSTSLLRSYMDKLEAAMPKESK